MHPSFDLSPLTAALLDALCAVSLGATITYDDLSRAASADVTGPARGHLASARRIALREHGAVFRPLRGVGLTRLHADEAAEIGSGARRKIGRASTRAIAEMRRLVKASNGQSPEAARKTFQEISAHGLIRELSADRIVEKVKALDRPAPPGEVARGFLEALGHKFDSKDA